MVQWLRIKNANTKLAENQEWATLHGRKEDVDFGGNVGVLPVIRVALELTPDELERHMNGEPIVLSVVGGSWPPIHVGVGDDG